MEERRKMEKEKEEASFHFNHVLHPPLFIRITFCAAAAHISLVL